MHMSRNLRTIYGALAVFMFASVLVSGPAQASDKPKMTSTVQCNEEVRGNTKYQVARAVVNASPTIVQSVLTDYERAPKVFGGLKECRVIQENGPVKHIAFIASAPGNLWTFDYVLEVKETPGYIEWHRVSGAFKKNEGFWKLEPINEGRSTQVTYAKYVDSGLFCPQSLINHELRLSLSQIMTNLKDTCETDIRLAKLPNGVVVEKKVEN